MRVRTPAIVLMVLTLVVVGAVPGLAVDGEMLEWNNVDRFTEVGVYQAPNGNKSAIVSVDHGAIMNDCPTTVTSCSVQYRWRHGRRTCVLFCWDSWSQTGAFTLFANPTGPRNLTYCPGNGQYRMDLQVRLAWTTQGTRTMEVKGYLELLRDLGVSTQAYRYIPVGLRLQGSYGLQSGIVLETQTVQQGWSQWTSVATTGAAYVTLGC